MPQTDLIRKKRHVTQERKGSSSEPKPIVAVSDSIVDRESALSQDDQLPYFTLQNLITRYPGQQIFKKGISFKISKQEQSVDVTLSDTIVKAVDGKYFVKPRREKSSSRVSFSTKELVRSKVRLNLWEIRPDDQLPLAGKAFAPNPNRPEFMYKTHKLDIRANYREQDMLRITEFSAKQRQLCNEAALNGLHDGCEVDKVLYERKAIDGSSSTKTSAIVFQKLPSQYVELRKFISGHDGLVAKGKQRERGANSEAFGEALKVAAGFIRELREIHNACDFKVASYDSLQGFLAAPPRYNALVYLPQTELQGECWFFVDNGNRRIVPVRGKEPMGKKIMVRGLEFEVIRKVNKPKRNAEEAKKSADKCALIVGKIAEYQYFDGRGLDLSVQECEYLARYISEIAGTIHGDIKPENAFYSPDTGEVNFVDWGCSHKAGLTTSKLAQSWSPGFKPPEFESTNAVISEAADRFALGVVVWELFTLLGCVKDLPGINTLPQWLQVFGENLPTYIQRGYSLPDNPSDLEYARVLDHIAQVIIGLAQEKPEKRMSLATAHELISEAADLWLQARQKEEAVTLVTVAEATLALQGTGSDLASGLSEVSASMAITATAITSPIITLSSPASLLSSGAKNTSMFFGSTLSAPGSDSSSRQQEVALQEKPIVDGGVGVTSAPAGARGQLEPAVVGILQPSEDKPTSFGMSWQQKVKQKISEVAIWWQNLRPSYKAGIIIIGLCSIILSSPLWVPLVPLFGEIEILASATLSIVGATLAVITACVIGLATGVSVLFKALDKLLGFNKILDGGKRVGDGATEIKESGVTLGAVDGQSSNCSHNPTPAVPVLVDQMAVKQVGGSQLSEQRLATTLSGDDSSQSTSLCTSSL